LLQLRSYVKREGRLTLGQKHALETLWPEYGVDFSAGNNFFQTDFFCAKPIILDIGFGNGVGLVEQAEAQQDKNFIGIEVFTNGIGQCLRCIKEQELKNIRLIKQDAWETIQRFPENSIQKIQLFFPDPWPKKRHHKRRLLQAGFLDKIDRILKPGGVFHAATDWQNYAEHMLAVLSAHSAFENMSPTQDYIERPADRPLTKFEQRGLNLGHGVWDVMFSRK
jgi:tRNA (guanine-N7-)-methyltransferase